MNINKSYFLNNQSVNLKVTCNRCESRIAENKCYECNSSYFCNECSNDIHSSNKYKNHKIEKLNLIPDYIPINPLLIDKSDSLSDIILKRKQKIQPNKTSFNEIQNIYNNYRHNISIDSQLLKSELVCINNNLNTTVEYVKDNITKTYNESNKNLKEAENNFENKFFLVNSHQEKIIKRLQESMNLLAEENLSLELKNKENIEEMQRLKDKIKEYELKLVSYDKRKNKEIDLKVKEYEHKIDLIYEEIENEKKQWKEELNYIQFSKDHKIDTLQLELNDVLKENSNLKALANDYISSREVVQLTEQVNKLQLDNEKCKLFNLFKLR